MPKMKTHKGTAKRVRKTANGKLVREQAGVTHLMEHKSNTRRRRQQREANVSKSDAPRIRRLLGG